jgi:hypothetical protein
MEAGRFGKCEGANRQIPIEGTVVKGRPLLAVFNDGLHAGMGLG